MPKLPLVFLIIVSLLGCCMEIDLSIPSFPSIMAFFEATEAQVQSTLSLNFLAFCLSGLLYGPLSEAWGRRGLMLFGATCFLIGALGCVLSNSIYQLMFWRFVQGLGASSTLVLGFTMISDRYRGDIAAKYIGKINAYVTIFMAAAPILGSVIIHYFSWRANFTAVAFIAFVAWCLLVVGLPETKEQCETLKVKSILNDYVKVCTDREFLLYACMPNMLVTAYLTFVGSAAFYYINTCELPVLEFAIHQGLLVLCFSAMSFYADKVVSVIGSTKAVSFGMFCCVCATALLVIFAFMFPYQPVFITSAMCLFAVGCAFPMSVTFAQSLEILPDQRGTASSFIMSSRLLISSIAVAATGYFFDGSMRPVALIIAVAVVCALGLYLAIEKSKQASDTIPEAI
ncbi:multidrug effflux MFS transporter [Candidatus Berkiella cookevillensis]|uniref:Bicyclomycin resistance protein n=2 Tax=Candidatus Berkiella cookevillensis TaxID=437022 RepID=A0A0Q9YES5_9GAMM|nr:multidrug effflux MFS transporter [Candidatus Berkiella cookevillensis]